MQFDNENLTEFSVIVLCLLWLFPMNLKALKICEKFFDKMISKRDLQKNPGKIINLWYQTNFSEVSTSVLCLLSPTNLEALKISEKNCDKMMSKRDLLKNYKPVVPNHFFRSFKQCFMPPFSHKPWGFKNL